MQPENKYVGCIAGWVLWMMLKWMWTFRYVLYADFTFYEERRQQRRHVPKEVKSNYYIIVEKSHCIYLNEDTHKVLWWKNCELPLSWMWIVTDWNVKGMWLSTQEDLLYHIEVLLWFISSWLCNELLSYMYILLMMVKKCSFFSSAFSWKFTWYFE